MGSDVLDFEVHRNPDLDRRMRVGALLSRVYTHVTLDGAVRERGKRVAALGFRSLDALHLACAESGGADVLLTTDDRMQRLAVRLREQLAIQVANPLTWIVEVMKK